MGQTYESKPPVSARQGSEVDARTTTNAQPAERLTKLPPILDVGEQVFGSDLSFELPPLFNVAVGRGNARLLASIEGNAFSVGSVPGWLVESGVMSRDQLDQHLHGPIRIRFAPVADGELPTRFFAATLRVVVTWDDGHVEIQTVRLRGQARLITEPPTAPRAPAKESQQHTAPSASGADELASASASNAASQGFDDAARSADDAANGVADQQQAGLRAVIREAGSYQPHLAKRSPWWDLAEAAILMGATSLGGYLAGLLAAQVAKGVMNTTNASVVSGLAGAMESGLTKGATTGLAKVIPQDETEVPSKLEDLAFFEAQEDALNNMVHENRKLTVERRRELRPLLATHPETAVAAMQAVAASLEQTRLRAKAVQKAATSVEWIAYKGRLAWGTEQLANKETVTNLDRVRQPFPFVTENSTELPSLEGLLDLIVDIEHGAPHVKRASVSGVAQAIAKNLATADLASARMPIRFILGWNEPNPTVILRDEAGRVRVTGDFARLSKFDSTGTSLTSELQAERAARSLVELALSRTLAGWHAPIHSDDLTQPRSR